MAINETPTAGRGNGTSTGRVSSEPLDGTSGEVVDWTDLGRSMWSFLTVREAAINYRFVDMSVEVPRDTGSNAPRAVWKLNGTLQVTTDDNASDRG
ncbi:hypothetical protein [Nocardioides ungokensis]|uniref:hypothetical protein n=1 Tax=Nocardioides ungokensis TaxID=1643322 RepID=UPI001C60AF5E|nr:hypothetical protein [Nocardioides ungokensis]